MAHTTTTVPEMSKIFVAREVPIRELVELGSEVLAKSQLVQEAQEAYAEARGKWQMLMEVPENRRKYYGQAHLKDLRR